MAKQFMMGNEAMGMGAIRASVNVVSGYPGTPSTEILETIAKHNDGSIHVEWSVNEKAGLEVAAGAAYAGARALVTMKQVGLNVASDPLMSLAYVGVKGGMVVVSADDPGPISSQTEQDTRRFAQFAKLPVFDPASPEEAYLMMEDAFALSEKINSPVLFKPTTRVCHGSATIDVLDTLKGKTIEGFVKDTNRWVIFPRLSYANHIKIEERNKLLSDELSTYRFNFIEGKGRLGIATGGISYQYVKEALCDEQLNEDDFTILKIGTPHPFPTTLAKEFLGKVDTVLVVEELDPVIEEELLKLCGANGINVKILGKLTGDVKNAGENSVETVKESMANFAGITLTKETMPATPKLPVRPPVLCAGCPHRASFYAVKQAMKGRKAVFSGDIGCYTLGNAMPLDMTDTCLCMGAGITIAQGLHIVEKDAVNFAFVGDSTFFAAGITGVVNAVYNQNKIVLIVLDNSTTAMTGHQPHPGTGRTMMGDIVNKISITKILEGIGVTYIKTVDPLNQEEAVATVKEAAEVDGVSAIIFKSPCIAVSKPLPACNVNQDKCIGCKKCINEIGCPAIVMTDGKVTIEPSLCFGCKLCTGICPVHAIDDHVTDSMTGRQIGGGKHE